MSSDINVQSFSGKVNITSNLLVGSSDLFVDTTNNRVGLVTNNPDSGLHVNSNAYVNTDFRVGSDIVMNEVAGRITADSFVGNGSGLTSISSDSGSWVNGSSSNIHLAVSTNNVGIGVVDPETKLHLYDTTSEPTIAFQHLSGTENNSSTNILGNLALHYSARSGGYPSVGIRSIRRANTWDDQADMEFYVRNGANGEQTAMVINSSSTANGAKLGLGTSSPNKRLHVLHTDDAATGLLLENTDTGSEGRPHIEFKNNIGSAYIQFNGSGRSYPNQMGVLNNNGDITIGASNCVSYDNVYWYGRGSTTTDGSVNFHGTGVQTQIQIVERSSGDIGLYGTSYVKINSKFAEGIYVVYCHVSISTGGTRDRGYTCQLVKNGSTVFCNGRINVDYVSETTYNQIVLSGLINLSNGDYVSHQTTTNASFQVHKPDTRFYMYRISSL
jgi:hypothetical protein